MKPSSSNSRSKGHAKAHRKTREELDQEARDRKCQKKRRGHAPGSRAAGSNITSGSKDQNILKDSRIGSKTPTPLGMAEKVAKQYKPKSEKSMLSPQAELGLLGTDERLDALPERLEAGKTLSAEEQSWVDAKLDRINELMQKLGLSCDDGEEEEEDEKQEDMMRLLRGSQRVAVVGLLVLLIILPVICYPMWLFVKLQWLSRRQKWLHNRLMTRNGHPPICRSRQRRHRKE